MMRVFKYIALTLLMLIVLVVVTVAVLLWRFDVNNYKTHIEQAASDALDKHVEIAGPLSLTTTDWRPALQMQDISIGNAAVETVVRIKSLTVSGQLNKDKIWERETWENSIQDVMPDVLDIDVRSLSVDGRAFGDFVFPLKIVDGGAEILSFKGQANEINSSGKISIVNGALKANVQLDHVPYSLLAADIEGGNGRAVLELTTQLGPKDVMLGQLDGHVSFVGNEGQAAGKAVNLWGADLLTSLLFGESVTKINCAVADFMVEKGLAKSRVLVVDTGLVTVFGEGAINLEKEIVNMTLTPKPKARALLNLNAPIKVKGPYDNLSVAPEAGALLKKLGGYALGIVNPAALLVPYVLQGTSDDNACLKALQE